MVRIGIIGMGFIGTSVGSEIHSLDDADVVAISDIDDGTLRTAGEQLDVPESSQYLDYLDMYEQESLDGVVISTPHTLHYEQILSALDNGLHVLCEKPLATNLEHAYDIADRVARSDVTLMVGYQRHLDPAFITAREHVRGSGSRPKFITAEITQNWIENQRGTWRANPALSGGGQLYDTGSHLIDAVLWITGLTPSTVSAEMVYEDEEERVDIQASVNVEFEEGAVASIAVSGDTPFTREHIHVWNDEGAIYVDGEEWGAREVSLVDESGTARLPSGTEYRSKGVVFVETIRTGAEPPATVADALAVTAVTEAAYESARSCTGVTIDLDRHPVAIE